jgi:hypothetical protein
MGTVAITLKGIIVSVIIADDVTTLSRQSFIIIIGSYFIEHIVGFIKHIANGNENLLDCGCGNGKNMLYANSLGYTSEGFDITDNLLYICHNKGLNVFYQDVLN